MHTRMYTGVSHLSSVFELYLPVNKHVQSSQFLLIAVVQRSGKNPEEAGSVEL